MTILVTAASGQLGPLVIDALLARGAQPADLVASARDTSKLADVAARGIRTVELDYSRPDTIAAALDGVDTVLLISGSEPGSRLAGHRNVIDAAKAAGVTKLVYTSAPEGDHRRLRAGRRPQGHRGGDRRIGRSRGDPAPQLVHRELRGGCRRARPRPAPSRHPWATAAWPAPPAPTTPRRRRGAARGRSPRPGLRVRRGRRVGLRGARGGGSEVVGRPVEFVSLTTAEHVAALESVGLDAGTAASSHGIDAAIRRGVLADSGRDAVAPHRAPDDAARRGAAGGRAEQEQSAA